MSGGTCGNAMERCVGPIKNSLPSLPVNVPSWNYFRTFGITDLGEIRRFIDHKFPMIINIISKKTNVSGEGNSE